MDITLYKNVSDNNVINKTITEPMTITGSYKGKVDILTLSLLLNFKGDFLYNYCFVKDLNRFYYIDNISYYPKNIVELELKIDVLMSYKDEILNGVSDITTLENYNNYTNDGYISECKKDIEIYKSDKIIDIENNNIMVVVSQ